MSKLRADELESLSTGKSILVDEIDSGVRADLASPSGAAMVSYRHADDDAVPVTIGSKLSDRVSVTDFGESGDGAGIQAMANACDLRQARYIYIPNWDRDYLISSTITLTHPGVKIFGDQGGTYNRGTKKKGWLKGASGLTRIMDLGNFRTTGNPADNWEIEGLSFTQNDDAPARTIDGVSFTMRQNGPDRGANIISCSFIGLKDAVTTENPDIETVLANLNIERSVFQNNDAAVAANGMCYGLRFVGNQCEQNAGSSGVIRGYFSGCVTINDNMLEGQANPVSLDIPPVTGSRLFFRSQGNYFEANTGGYIYRIRTTAQESSAIIGPNFILGMNADDYVLFEDSLGATFVDVYDDQPVTFKNSPCIIKYGSNILRNRQRGYRVRQVNAAGPTQVVISDFQNLTDLSGTHTHISFSSGTDAMTPFGTKKCHTTGFVQVPIAVQAGDLVELNMLVSAETVSTGTLQLQVYNNNQTQAVAEWPSAIGDHLRGRWALVSTAFVASSEATRINVRLFPFSGSHTFLIAGITAKNHGAFVNDGSDYKLITPVTPNL